MTTPGDNRSMRERMLAGDLYRGADDELVAEMEQAMRTAKRYNDSDPADADGRRTILEELPTHPLDPQTRRDKWEAALPITIGDNVWIGGMAVVCPGVTVGEDAVVGAGAVVTKDVAPGTVVVGNPARVVRSVYDQ